VIKDGAFYSCSQVTNVILGEGLEEIGVAAFGECSSRHEILTPNDVMAVKDGAFT
jgi:hypothetical protein